MNVVGPPTEPDDEALDVLTIQRGAVRGASLLIARSIALQIVTAGATIAIARLLSPADYGAFAVAFVFQTVGRALVEIGLPVAFIRRPSPPTQREERALTGLLFASGSGLAAVALLVAFVALPALGTTSALAKQVAVAFCTLPIYALRAVPAILLERELAFGRLVVIEASETLSYYAFALPTAIAGLGAWSLIGGLPCAAAVGVVVALIVRPWRLALSLDLAVLRPVLAFGAQAAALLPIEQVRELGVVALLAAVGGQALAGFYGMSQRVFSITKAIQYAIARVSVAALSRERVANRHHRTVQGVAVTLIAVSLPVAAIAGSAEPLITTLFGHRWAPTATIVLWGAAGILIGIGLWSVLSALALADGDARSPLIGGASGALVSVLVAGALSSSLGTTAAGISITAGALVSAAFMLSKTAVDRRACLALTARALLITGAAAGVGQLMPGGDDVGGAVAAVAASSVSWLCLVSTVSRSQFSLLLTLLRRHVLPGDRDASVPDGAPQPSGP